jgi:nitrate reductase delta subunit
MNFSQFQYLLKYPSKTSISAIIEMKHKDKSFQKFKNYITSTSKEKLQEKYTQTFDMNPSTCLDIGWHLYGEAYERGSFLVKLRSSLRDNNINESTELPDHLTHIFMLMECLDEEEQQEFSREYTIPALKKILDGFDDESENPFENAIKYIFNKINSFVGESEIINGVV